MSGLVFPGLGQIVLKHYKRGAAIMFAFMVTLTVIVVGTVMKAFTILEKIQSEGGTIDMNTISNAATQASTTSDSLIFNFSLLLLLFFWIIGIVDAFRIGKKKDVEQPSENQVSNRKGNFSH